MAESESMGGESWRDTGNAPLPLASAKGVRRGRPGEWGQNAPYLQQARIKKESFGS